MFGFGRELASFLLHCGMIFVVAIIKKGYEVVRMESGSLREFHY